MKVLCLYGSPRKKGNTDILMDEFIQGIEEAGGKAEKIYLRELNISPCDSCGGCYKNGVCSKKDGMLYLHAKFMECEVLCLSAPVYFLSLPAQVKAVIDRCQVYWVKKYILGEQLRESRGKGVFLSASGTKSDDVFYCAEKLARVFFNTLEYECVFSRFFGGMEKKGDIIREFEGRKEVKEFGKKLVYDSKKGGSSNESIC
ncbi:MAG: flavodoxin family protein [Caldiserica bacterium]|nr:flavodoxin family protein [Caldisericota bacterium]